jgi:pimeloyl-ACP methyl ester carboxylesterase
MLGVASAVIALATATACTVPGGGGGLPVPKALPAGKLLTAQPATSSAVLPSSAHTVLITYMSRDDKGKPIVVSGTVAIPKTRAPRGGYPVISWAHGTSGYADTCAPSEDTPDGPDHDYFAVIDPTLDAWVARGFAVVQTDYEGLGTPGGHPYINGVSEANTVTDIVRAGRQLDPELSSNWFVMGHSQGGQAALFTATRAKSYAPELRLRGAVPIAPGGTGLAQTVPYIQSNQPGAAAAEAFLPLILLGAQAADPAIVPEQLLSDAALPALTAARTGCLAQIRAVTPIPPQDYFRAGADFGPLTSYLQKQDPSVTDPKVPTMIAQGTADTLVSKLGTDGLVKTLCQKGADIQYKVYAGADHRGSVGASLSDAETFVDQILRGHTPASTC